MKRRNSERTNLFIEYNANEKAAKVNFYTDGVINSTTNGNNLSDKILSSYSSNISIAEDDDGYDLHISFEVH